MVSYTEIWTVPDSTSDDPRLMYRFTLPTELCPRVLHELDRRGVSNDSLFVTHEAIVRAMRDFWLHKPPSTEAGRTSTRAASAQQQGETE